MIGFARLAQEKTLKEQSAAMATVEHMSNNLQAQVQEPMALHVRKHT